ncbi:DUF6544 family protein [Methanothermobacter sp. K4]|uniref:DUF6544 family protein n=1 Tax=Methanothermobacter sp. K4 TaxID=2913262 RepID=UPI001EDBBF04|nr:DUF6544 family protein [Methanothermobacter sp. K4]MCG2828891.1 hypothetical protein [Methanothermobacter sp. K4]
MKVEEELKNDPSLNERELPDQIRRHISLCSLPEVAENLLIRWGNSRIRRGERWMDIDMLQFNTPTPFRCVHIAGRFFWIPMEGLDLYSEGHGRMIIRALKFLGVADEHGPEMDQSALVTVLSESLFLPSLTMSECIEWYALDDTRVEATISDHGVEAHGIFSFDEHGRFVGFHTEDRYCAEFNMEMYPWSVEVLSYRKHDGFIYPHECTATWHLPEGDLKYFHGSIDKVHFNMKTLGKDLVG